ncbi:hypothetical protein IW245_002762 [Longispora fulva]|uniref:Uncharacterized protein n=1 Tax=Longispora fulva TaxID=619741 RepID=A0A8J7GHT0_9ACTN|nr:hypothetical protein [Longispora fulva]
MGQSEKSTSSRSATEWNSEGKLVCSECRHLQG